MNADAIPRLPTNEEVEKWPGFWRVPLVGDRTVTTRLRVAGVVTRHGIQQMPVIVDIDPSWNGVPIGAFYSGGDVTRVEVSSAD